MSGELLKRVKFPAVEVRSWRLTLECGHFVTIDLAIDDERFPTMHRCWTCNPATVADLFRGSVSEPT